jgi:predicted TIM-barrel fold metal-dependent hydrolase
MIIDTHTHVYPEKIARVIADKALSDLGEGEGTKLCGPMTIPGLLSAMERGRVDISIAFCIAERPERVRVANDFVIDHCDRKRLCPLGTIHPDFGDYQAEIDRLRQNGIRGVKWSSLFQDFYPDEERMMRLYEAMGEDMIAYLHVGSASGAYAEHCKATPERLARVMEAFPKLKLVAAHFGGMGMLEDARKHLFGKNLFLDTAWPLGELDPRLVAEIITEHGPDRIVFGTDYPFGDMARDVAFIRSLPISQDDKECVLWKNAKELFGV